MPYLLLKNQLYSDRTLSPVRAPGSKSVCNRVLLLAAMAKGASRILDPLDCDDTRRMRDCLRHLGIPVQETPMAWRIEGGVRPRLRGTLATGASGTTLRFLLPWLALHAEEPVRFSGDSRLFERPLGGLLAALRSLGAAWEPQGPGGLLRPSSAPPRKLELELEASASSQFVTGLALAAASLPGGGRLRWPGTVPSTSYLELTAHWLEAFGCRTRLASHEWTIPGASLQGCDLRIPGDWSGAAAFLCAAAVTGGRVRVSPLDPSDPQGDRAILDILAAAGCQVAWTGADQVTLAGPLARGLACNLERCPDLGPVLAATAALAPGPSTLSGLHTLALKECDRLEASVDLVRWLGGTAQVLGNHTLEILPGPCPGDRPPFDPRNDHRMAFAAAVGALRCGGELLNPGCVAKTLPTFWEDWNAMLGSGR